MKIFILSTLSCLFFAFNSSAQSCSPIVSTVNNGPVQIVIYSAEGECFKTKLINQYLFPDYSNQITFFESVGMKKIKVELASGEIIEKTLAINETYAKATFEIRKNKKDQYVVKLLPFQVETNGPSPSELMEQALADRKAFEAKSAAESAAAKQAKIDKKAKEEADLLAEQKVVEDKILQEKAAKLAEEKALEDKKIAAEKAKNAPKETNTSSASGEGITLKISNGGSPAVDWKLPLIVTALQKDGA